VSEKIRIILAASVTLLSARAESVAILPYANISAASVPQVSNLDWIGESIAETLRQALGARGLVALERNEIEETFARLRLRGRTELTDASVLKVGEAVDAEHIVFGTFSFTPAPAGAPADTKGSLKISGRLIDRRRFRQSPEFSETGALEDLPTLEAHLAWRALYLLAPAQAPPEADFRSLRAPLRLDAEENYIRGLLAAAPEQKEKYFTQAARLDPRLTNASFELGKLYFARKQYREAADWLEKVAPAAVHSRDASFLLGLARFELADYAAAQKAFQTVAAVVPLSEVYNNLAAAESRRNLPQAVDDFRKALAGDPTDPDYHFNVGYVLWKRGDFSAAADRFRAVLDRNPDDQMATLMLGRCLKKQPFRPGETRGPEARFLTLERLKRNYQERAYWQLKSVLESGTP
jgi:tetratricopeptide (TPR) repeat protein